MTINIDTITLKAGAHSDAETGTCLLEAVSFVAGERFSDHPQCVSPVLGAYGRRLNDRLGDEDRQKLKPFIPLMIGTAGDGQDEARLWLASDWAIRVATPRWLDAAGMPEHAAALRGLAPITDYATAAAARGVARAARDDAWSARVKAREGLRAKVRAELERRGVKSAAAAVAVAAAVADAVAVADAAAVADAVAVAVAAAAAVAVADAAAVAVAVADAAAVADAVAAAAADAAAAAAADADAAAPWGATYSKVYDAVYAKLKPRYLAALDDSKYAEVARTNNAEAIALLGIMINPSRVA